jgi:hypothetical protein
MRILSVVMMVLSLIAQGVYFWARDLVTPSLPGEFFASDVVWTITLFSLLCYKRYPWVTITCSWGLLFTVAMLYWTHFSHYMVTTLLIVSAPSVINVVFAHLGLRSRTAAQV